MASFHGEVGRMPDELEEQAEGRVVVGGPDPGAVLVDRLEHELQAIPPAASPSTSARSGSTTRTTKVSSSVGDMGKMSPTWICWNSATIRSALLTPPWGATDNEVRRPLPGDQEIPQPTVQSTRAITIAAPPAEVWPWIA